MASWTGFDWVLHGVQAVFALLFVTGLILVNYEDRRNKAHHKKHGWYVRGGGGADESTVDYYEGDNRQSFIGPRSGEYVEVPTAEAWDSLVKEFARGRRDLILGRMKEKFPRKEFREVTRYTL